MKKQFELIEKLYTESKASEERIRILREQVQEEFNKIRDSLINVYSHDVDIMYLVQFHSYGIYFFKATKEKLYEVKITFFEQPKYKGGIPKTLEDAEQLLATEIPPTNCEIHSYRTFGYFDDVKNRWDRINFITEETMERKFLFEITEQDFINAVKKVSKFYGN